MFNHVQCLVLIFGLLTIFPVPYYCACPDGQFSWRSFCYTCPSRCALCTSRSTCTSCKDGSYLYNRMCYNCDDSNCKQCSTRNVCSICYDGYYVDNNRCRRCESKCNTCLDSNTCTSCNQGNYLDGSFKCRQCPHSGTTCECNPGSYFDGSVCQGCSSPCVQCLSAATCTLCAVGYRFHDSHCCPNICQTCSGNNVCTACLTGYHLSGTQCCPDACSACSATNMCTTCKAGYHLSGTQCCQDACSSCSATNICTSCKTGYHLSGTQCCPNTCSTCSDSNTCTLCNTGYHLTTGSQCCSAACSACSSAKVCTSCKNGFYMDGGQCKQCSDSCVSCGANNVCFGCKQDYRLMSGQCYICPNECSQCSADNTCTSCIDARYYVDNQSCVECPEQCLSCNSHTECTSCRKGFHDSNKCLQECSTNCKDRECDIDGRCKTCVDGFHGVGCDISCQQYCSRCDRITGACLSCDNGKHLENGQCKSCSASCTQCTSTRCTECVDGRWGNTCEKECLNCKPGTSCRKSDGICEQSCVDGMTGIYCNKPCSSNCLSCQRYFASKCTACVANKYGYYNTHGYYCNQDCLSNCLNATCDDKTGKCSLGCIDGYHGKTCQCPQNCNCKYTYPGQCTSCKDGFGNVNQNCECTNENCVNTDCSACKHASYYVHDTTCCSCREYDARCEECTTGINGGFGECIKCKKGFYPYSNQNACTECSSSCKDNTCDPVAGNCTLGCQAGRRGFKCENNCHRYCSECDQYNGTCTVCSRGKYSSDCSQTCSRLCKTIDNVPTCAIHDGACVNGCSNESVYGSQCQHSCSINCTNTQCNWQTGHCSHGCIDNQYGNVCNIACSHTCSIPDLGSRCYDTNGTCVDGCVDGYYGNKCDGTCSQHCVNITCEQFTGSCLHGCHGGYEGNNCMIASSQAADMTVSVVGGVCGLILICLIVLVIVFVIKRRRAKNSTSTAQEAVAYADIPQGGDGSGLEDECPVYATPNKKGKPANKLEEKTATTGIALSNLQSQASAVPDDVTSDSVYVNTPARTPPRMQKPKRSKTRDSSADKTVAVLHDEERANRQSTTILEEKLETDDDEAFKMDNDTYYNVCEVMKRKITLDQLQQYVANKTKADFITEFQTLPVGLIKSYKISQSSENASKNRYQGIYPYDDTLVKLKGENAGYMNASYIDGYQKTHAYIASMGPAVKYMKDISPFWKMIWQENVGKIVMLTRTWEGGTNKCDQYWPDEDFTDTHADIRVTCQSELQFAEYALRSFQVSRKNEKRLVQQIHYTAWPDKGTPDDVTSLVEFRQKVNSVRTNLTGPVLVHCSAGIGRTGTYIALDILAREGETEQSVDILACVRNMREQRVNMVQTWDQYRYLHNTIVHTLTFDSQPIEATGFQNYMAAHSNDVLGTKFQELQATLECRSEDETNAINRNKGITEKNRKGADIPGDLDRPRVYLGITHGSSDYINALFVNSYRQAKYFVLTQTPLPTTLSDFLALVVQEKCPLIINMDAETMQREDIGAYCPVNNETIKSGPFTVKTSSRKRHENYTQRELTIKYQHSSRTDQVDVTHVQFSQWPQKMQVPNTCDQFLQFIKEVDSLSQKVGTSGPVMVHCSTGAKRSGFFCVVSVLLEKIEYNQEVSVVNTVRQIKSKRHMAIPNQEQFIFCHECINAYLTSIDIYSNFVTRT